MNKIAIISLSGLGNSLLTALALKNSTYSKTESTIYLTNNFSKSIFEYYSTNSKFKIYKQGRFKRLFLILIDLIFSDYSKVIIEPNTSKFIIEAIRLFSFKKVLFIKNSKTNPIEIDYQKLFSIKKNVLNSKQFVFSKNDNVMIYPCVESSDKYSKKITEKQVKSITESLDRNQIEFKIVIPEYEKNQLSSSFILKYLDSIEYIDRFDNFDILLRYFNEFDIYIGGDTFYYHIMAKALEKKSYIIFGSTSFSRFIYRNEATKYFYPNCKNYPMYEKYFSKVNYCNYCKAEYCIEKVKINLFNYSMLGIKNSTIK